MKNVITGLFVLMALPLFSQHSVSGTVIDQNNGEPLIGATLFLEQSDAGVITDLEGRFLIQDVPAGKIVLRVSSLGYATKTVAASVPVEKELKILLAPTAIEMKEVIVSTPFHQLQSDNVMKVERVSMKDLSEAGKIGLAAGLADMAGVETITTGSGIGKPVIRGLSSNRVLVYAQGVRLENQQFGAEHGLGVNAAGVESVEVIKGPASLLYGSDALGGVLYLNPERYAPAESLEADIQTTYYTNTEGVQAGAGVRASGEHLRYLLRASTAFHSDYETGADYRVTNTRFRERDLKSGMSYRNDHYRGDLRYNLNSSKIGIPEHIAEQSLSKEIVIPFQQVENHILSLDNSFYFPSSSLDVKLGYLYNNRQEYEDAHHEHMHAQQEHEEHEEELPEPVRKPALEMHLETFNYDLKYHLPEHHRFETIIGLQGMYQTNKNFAEEVLIPDATVADFGIMGTTHYHLADLDFQAGLRYDHRRLSAAATDHNQQALERSFNSYNFALGAKADLTPDLVTRLNLATGYRAPNLAELTSYGSHHGTNRFEIGNPLLDHEQNIQLDLALEYGNQHFEGFVNAFYNRIWNYIFLSPTGIFIEEDPVYEYSQSAAKLYGGEAGIHFHPHPLDWLHLESSYEMVTGKKDEGSYLPLIPAHAVLNTLRVEFPGDKALEKITGSVSLKTVFDQNQPGTFETATPGYSLLSASLGMSYRLSSARLNLRINGTNLLDKAYISHLSRLKPEGIENMGRNISFTAGLSF